VGACAEGQVRIWPSIKEAPIWLGKYGGITIRGGEGEGHDPTCGDRGVMQINILGGISAEDLNWRDEPEELLDGRLDQFWSISEPGNILGICCQVLQRGANGIGRRFEARAEHDAAE
jgi:hypothetical protein